jgi:hypothetical protein
MILFRRRRGSGRNACQDYPAEDRDYRSLLPSAARGDGRVTVK